jgi:hypothetical protein
MLKNKFYLIISGLIVLFGCNPDTLENKADSTVTGKVLPGDAQGTSGAIIVVASHTNNLQDINWAGKRDVLNRFGSYEIDELVGGKYYIAVLLDANRNNALDSGEFWGGHDANGDGRLDLVQVLGGKTTEQDISFIAKY